MKIFRRKSNEISEGCVSTRYFFIGYDFWVQFFQEDSQDLVFTVDSFTKVKEKASFIVKKEENPEIYDLISKMLQNIENNKYYDFGDEKKIIKEEYSSLFEKGYFSWQSDESENWNEPFIYNSLNIIPGDNEYIFEFINNINRPAFSVEINTNRSRYVDFRFNVWDLFNDLKDVCKEISEDEFKEVKEELCKNINTKKLLLVSNKYSEEEKNEIKSKENEILKDSSFNEYIPPHRYSRKEKTEIRKKEAQIYRRCALRDIYNSGIFGFQLDSVNGSIKVIDTHPKEFKYKKYADEESVKRLYKKINEVKKD